MVKVPLGRKTARSFPPPLSGSVELVPNESEILRDNPLQDPSRRRVAVYLPPSGKTEGCPLLVHLPGFAGAGWMEVQRETVFQETLIQLLDRLIRSGACREAVLVSPDGLTALGGSQYVNSSATGRYADYVPLEIVPWARERYRTGATGILGQSSGGFGALHLAAEFPDLFQAVASSAGDMAFEYSYLPDLLKAVREFRTWGGPERFLEKLFDDPTILRGPSDPSGAALIVLGLAACYSPRDDEPGSFDLPIDWETGAMVSDVWNRWLALDPVQRLEDPQVRDRWGRLRSLHVTASTSDEWFLDLAARRFAARAGQLGLPVIHEEFDGGHFLRNPRFEAMFTRMVDVLGGAPPAHIQNREPTP